MCLKKSFGPLREKMLHTQYIEICQRMIHIAPLWLTICLFFQDIRVRKMWYIGNNWKKMLAKFFLELNFLRGATSRFFLISVESCTCSVAFRQLTVLLLTMVT